MSEWKCVDDIVVEIGGGYIDIDAESFMNAPTIEIIRCRECKYTEFCEKKIHRHGIAYSINFCSCGERKS